MKALYLVAFASVAIGLAAVTQAAQGPAPAGARGGGARGGSAQGLITQYSVLEGNPVDEGHVIPSLENHHQAFGRAPEVFAADRGFDSQPSHNACVNAGVACASIPQRGGKKTAERTALEKTPSFKKAQRFRAGIEGRISVLFRGRGMKRCLAEGSSRFESFIAAAVLVNNLMRIGSLLLQREKKKGTGLKPRRQRAA